MIYALGALAGLLVIAFLYPFVKELYYSIKIKIMVYRSTKHE